MSKQHAVTLLNDAERANYIDGSNGETLAALYRLFEINPDRGFDAMLLDSVQSNEVGDPDTLIVGWQIRIEPETATQVPENLIE